MSTNLLFVDPENDVDLLEIRQRFTLPDDYALGEPAATFAPRDPIITQVLPNIIGFGFLARIDQFPYGPDAGLTGADALAQVEFDWALVDRTGGDNNIIRNGTFSGAVNLTQCWIDVFLDSHDPVETTAQSKFEFRIGKNKNQNPNPFNVVYTQSPAPLIASASPVSDNDIFLRSATGITEFTDYALIYRVWSDNGEAGKDVLGNRYREGVRRDKAGNATDSDLQTAWVSKPNPDPTGVEALYFDVRTRNEETNALIPSILDSIKVNPMFAGCYMHVYYSCEGVTVTGAPTIAPKTVDEWDQVLWTHVQQSYVLDTNQIYELPLPIRAAWVKLEFSNLQPIPFKVLDFPALPAVEYRQFPALVSENFVGPNRLRNSEVRAFEDHFLQNNVRVKRSIFDAFRPNRGDLDYEKRYEVTNHDVDINDAVFGVRPPNTNLDPVTLGRIYYSSSQTNWGVNVLTQMDAYNSVLGRRTQAIKAGSLSDHTFEILNPRGRPNGRQVSQVNDRTFDVISIPDMYFLETCRHSYKLMKAPFNGKAYAVGIREVEFLRNDFTTVRDDPFIHDSLGDPAGFLSSPLININTWVADPGTTIPVGTTCYVTYDVLSGDGSTITVEDEIVQFEGLSDLLFSFTPVPLAVNGGRAVNVKLWTGLQLSGNFYSPGTDYTIIYDPTTFANSIARNELHFRLTAT